MSRKKELLAHYLENDCPKNPEYASRGQTNGWQSPELMPDEGKPAA
jgi:hypothetical protein